MIVVRFSDYFHDNVQKQHVLKVRCLVRSLNPNAPHRCNFATDTQIFGVNEDADHLLHIFLKHLRGKHRYTIESKNSAELSPCPYCGGSGKRDWVMHARNTEWVHGDVGFVPQEEPQVCRLADNSVYKIQYLPELIDDERYCEKCGATGIIFRKYDTVFEGKLWFKVPPHAHPPWPQ